MRESIAKNFNDGRILSNARTAHITEGTKPGLGRVTCQYRNRCMRGCFKSSTKKCLDDSVLTYPVLLCLGCLLYAS